MSTKVNSFKTSVNIKFDLGKKEFVDRYLPTPSHAQSLLGLLKGFNDTKNKRSHIIVGPYGTGKSLIATIVGNITSKKIDSWTLGSLTKKFDKVHDDIYKELQVVDKLEKKYLTVVLNGFEGRFREALLNSIIKTINENHINIVLPGQYGKILETVNLWENKFPKTYKEFKKLLRENNKELNIWRLAIMNQEKVEVDWFISIYPQLTAGSKFVLEFNESFTDQIIHVLKELDKQNIGLFITYDEFGRLLQTLDTREIHETMQDLQDLAELIDHSCENFHLLLITHRNLSQYFSLISEEIRNEFQRIEKRFKVYYVESDKSTFIRLAEIIIQGLGHKNTINCETNKSLIQYLRKFPLFPELNQKELEKIIVEGIYPVHPVALFLLPFLSNSFGQNERTLFTFLESNETGGLLNHLSKTNSFYLASDLFSYFFPNIYDLDTSREEIDSLRIYKNLITKTPNLESNTPALNLLKLITLWQLAGLQSKIKLDTEFLCFALNINVETISTLLKELSILKIIRYNWVLGYWELLEGSSFQIEELLNERAAKSPPTRKTRLSVLENCLPKHFFFANEYNDQKSITRYARVKFILSSQLTKEEIDWKSLREKTKADAVVYYILIEKTSEINLLTEEIKKVSDPLSIFCISRLPFTAIEEQLTEYSMIEALLIDAELLNSDKNLKQELLLKREDLDFIINDFLSKYVSYGKDMIWIYTGKVISLSSEIHLENMLSKIMFENFSLTPEVRNDSFNRRIVNNVQRKAGQGVLDHIINNPYQNGFGIEGQGPDYLIYATIFKNNQLNISNLNDIENKELSHLRSVLINYIEQKNTGTLHEFFKIMTESPFGIREPLIPIYLVALLRDKWDQIMFYRNDLFVSGINGEKLYKMFDDSSEYSFVYYNFDIQYKEFFKVLEEFFGEYENDLVKNKPMVLRLNNSILTWLRKLPRITQITNSVPNELVWLKETIRRSEINPQESLTQLFNRFGNKIDMLLHHKFELESHYKLYKAELEDEILRLTNTSNFKELFSWASEQTPENKKKNNLVKSILKCNETNSWLENFILSFIGIDLVNWSDATYSLFLNQLKSEYKSTFDKNENAGDFIRISLNGTIKTINKVQLSTKSETIYRNVQRMIKNAGRNVTKEETEYLIFKLIDEFIE
ncbi:hypothetical protein [Neobacillus ginsengisoli]|uniref:ATP-binding protein n=1 Tax=Neobacillus ginsengisoli TaxID=904295 RepID=A0ABT9XZR0_9BACI|nr:hypothetical protein [Neobacillus ginsengisoli]MDQ0201064.1 hypothetical protein [Neobacillus ginsengisoli]